MAPISRCGAAVIAWLLGCIPLALGGEQREGGPGSLEQLYQQAKQLAQTPENVQQAAAKYRAVVETHLANEKTYRAALRELARSYDDSGQTEAGIRFFLGLVDQMEMVEGRAALREVVGGYLLKHRELAEKIAKEMNSPESRRRTPPRRPEAARVKRCLQAGSRSRRNKALRERGGRIWQSRPGAEISAVGQCRK